MAGVFPISFSIVISIAAWSCTDSGPSIRQANRSANSTGNCLNLSGNSWQANVSTIFQNKCGSCHPGTQSTNYTVYANVTGNISNIMNRINAGTMPPSGALAQEDKDALQAWITAGTPQSDSNGCNQIPAATPTPTPSVSASPSNVSYSLSIKPIMDANCTSCHSSSGGQSPDLTTEATVEANYSKVMSQVNSGLMPESGKLPDDKIATLQQWGSPANNPQAFAP